MLLESHSSKPVGKFEFQEVFAMKKYIGLATTTLFVCICMTSNLAANEGKKYIPKEGESCEDNNYFTAYSRSGLSKSSAVGSISDLGGVPTKTVRYCTTGKI